MTIVDDIARAHRESGLVITPRHVADAYVAGFCSASGGCEAVKHILHLMEVDPRLAWLIGPGSKTFDLLTEVAAVAEQRDVQQLRQEIESRLKYMPWPKAQGG